MLAFTALALVFALPSSAGTLTLEVLDVGQGDAILLRTPADKVVLIDAGDDASLTLSLLQKRHIDHIDLLVATHPHADHIGGMREVVEHIPVKLFTDNGLVHSTATYRALMESVERRHVAYRTATAGTKYTLDDGAVIEVLFPRPNAALHGTRSDINANSVVLRLKHQGHCFLFMGDAEEPTERALEDVLEPCDVLKVAHHGSEHSTTQRFLAFVKPRVALISVGNDNGYGHPGPNTLHRLEQSAQVHRTDRESTLVVRSDLNTLAVQSVSNTPAPTAEMTPSQTPAQMSACAFLGSANSHSFHEPTCRNAHKIKPENQKCFATRAAAEADGRRPAGCCKP